MTKQAEKRSHDRPERKPWATPAVRSMISSRRTAGGPLSPTIVESAVYGIS
ncbi:MAG TPA: hypothetical protein VEZ59_09715 [Sphingopyxis sp.]|nr:hypothetical protein [Sphingopyxis sp.]